jgi:hypothetical protein
MVAESGNSENCVMQSMLSAGGLVRRRWTGPTDTEASIQPKVFEVAICETRYKQTGPRQAGIVRIKTTGTPDNRVIKRSFTIARLLRIQETAFGHRRTVAEKSQKRRNPVIASCF